MYNVYGYPKLINKWQRFSFDFSNFYLPKYQKETLYLKKKKKIISVDRLVILILGCPLLIVAVSVGSTQFDGYGNDT